MSSRKKIAAVVISTVVLSVGTVGVASASQSKSTSKSVSIRQSTTRTTVNAMANPMAGGPMSMKDDPSAAVATVLAALVADNTITQLQANKITAALTAARAAHEAAEGANRAPMGPNRAERDALVATTIGKTTVAIKAELATGKSLGVVAGDKRAALITALVSFETRKIDAAVTAGKITSVQATALKTNLSARVTAEVDAVRPPMGAGMAMSGGKGEHGRHH